MQALIFAMATRARLFVTRARDDRGDLVQNLAWGAVSIVAIIAIGAAMQAFGVDVVKWAKQQLGVG